MSPLLNSNSAPDIASGRLSLEQTDFDLDQLIDRVTETFAARAHAKGLELISRRAPATPISLIGDSLRLRQVLVNLLGNAIKFTEHGSITLLVEPESEGREGTLHFTVTDTGIGLAADRLEELFSPFTQADYSMARRYGGSGLGLAIVKRLVELMDGRVWVESAEGVGSAFHFTARFLAQTRPEAPGELEPAFASMPVLVVDDNDDGRAAESGATEPKMRLLLVEDSPDNRLLVRAFLKKRPYLIDEAENGEIGVLKFSHEAYDVILMDLQMPVIDGLDATRLIREIEQTRAMPRTPIIALTASALDDACRCLEAGADAHVGKPVKKAALIDALRAVTRRSAQSGADAVAAIG
jgi:CheY-like chemotaxis protein/anti-sigma regulatory factor (Ser/Thr protein kinase)